MWPHLATVDVLVAMGLRAVWMAPNWLLKLLVVKDAIKRFRE
jgi:hypothetical protein